MKNIQVPAQLVGINTKVDDSLSLRFTTQELSDEDVLIILRHKNLPGYLLFSPNEFNEADVPREDAPETGKSQSQRLRGVLYRFWESLGSDNDFEVFYRSHMEKIIEHYKNKLPK